MRAKTFCGLIAGALLCNLALASDIISFLASTPMASTGSARTIQLQGFDPGWGTLTEVKLTYWGEVLQTGKVENTGSSTPFNYTLSGTANLVLSKTPGGASIFASPTGTFSFSQAGSISAPYDGAIDFGGTSGFTAPIQDTVWHAPASYLDSDLAAYLTTGIISFTSLATATGNAAINAGSGTGGVSTKASATLQVEYTYTQIPEPATYAAGLGLSVLGFVALRRRTRLAPESFR